MKKTIHAHTAEIEGEFVIIERIYMKFSMTLALVFFAIGLVIVFLFALLENISVNANNVLIMMGVCCCLAIIGFLFPKREVYTIPKKDLILIKDHYFIVHNSVTVVFDDSKNKFEIISSDI